MSRQQPPGVISFLFTSLLIWPQRSHPATAALSSTTVFSFCQNCRSTGSSLPPLILPLMDQNSHWTAGWRAGLWETSIYVKIPLGSPQGGLLSWVLHSRCISYLLFLIHHCGGIGRQPEWMEVGELNIWWKYGLQALIQRTKVELIPRFDRKWV